MSRDLGLMAAFDSPAALRHAVEQARAAGYERMRAYTPYPVEGLDEVLPVRPTPMGWIMFIAGVLGAAGAYGLQYWATHGYPINVGGRPLHSWPAFVPVTFELTVLTAAIVGVLALGCLCRLPRLDHPVFAVPGFERASQDQFFLLLRRDDPRFDPQRTRALLQEMDAAAIEEVVE